MWVSQILREVKRRGDSHTLLWKKCEVFHSSLTPAADQNCQISSIVIVEAVENVLYPMRGESTPIFAERFGSLLAIDPWMDDYDPSDATCQHASFTEVEAAFDERVSRYHNIRKLEATSDAAFLTLQNNTCDVVCIDDLHTYEQVRSDIMNYRQITTSVIAGHAFNPVDCPGVHRAVIENFGDNIQTFMYTSWATIL